MNILYPVCNWKLIKYLQEAFRASEFAGNKTDVRTWTCEHMFVCPN